MIAFKRRQFLNGMLGAGAATSLGGVTTLFPSLAQAAVPEFDDYKALVVLFMHGGNDAFNMVVPLDGGANRDYTTYATSRSAIAVSSNDLNPLDQNLADGTNRYVTTSAREAYLSGVYDYGAIGINGVMPELAQLVSEQKAAVVANIGTLVEPATKQAIKNRAVRLPPFLFAHNHQQRAMETGWADNLSAGGWAGRIADLWRAHTDTGINKGSPLGLNVSYGGATRMMTAKYNSPTVLSPGMTQLFRGGSYEGSVFKAINRESPEDHPLRRVLKAANYKTAELSEILANKLSDVTEFTGVDEQGTPYPKSVYGNDLFTHPGDDQIGFSGVRDRLLKSAKSAARMVKLGRDELGLKRQIIFIDMGGFDNHTELTRRHPLLLRELSLALWDFQLAMQSLGAEEQVTLCTMSDFGRSLGNNGDGTDHAWAGHNLVIGGAVNGGKMVGTMPDLRLGGPSDTGNKGRMIPDIAIDQYLATLTSWFGVEDEQMSELFPNLANFKPAPGDPISSAYLNGLMGEPEPQEPPNPLAPILDLLS